MGEFGGDSVKDGVAVLGVGVGGGGGGCGGLWIFGVGGHVRAGAGVAGCIIGGGGAGCGEGVTGAVAIVGGLCWRGDAHETGGFGGVGGGRADTFGGGSVNRHGWIGVCWFAEDGHARGWERGGGRWGGNLLGGVVGAGVCGVGWGRLCGVGHQRQTNVVPDTPSNVFFYNINICIFSLS